MDTMNPKNSGIKQTIKLLFEKLPCLPSNLGLDLKTSVHSQALRKTKIALRIFHLIPSQDILLQPGLLKLNLNYYVVFKFLF